jgi:ABC-type branched-subunit amino acid transport system substrate-binding protein
MTWAPQSGPGTDMVGMPAIAEAFAKGINAHGGISGRPLKVLTCDEGNDRVLATRCAERAVEERAVAVVGSYSENGSQVMPSLEGAGIPFIGGYGIAGEEFSSPLSYPVNGGTATLLAGNGRQLADDDCDRVALVRPDNAAGDLFSEFLGAGLRTSKVQVAADVMAAENAGDYTQEASTAVGDDPPGSCVSAVLGERTQTFLDSYRRLGTTNTKLASVLGSVHQSLVASTGGSDGPLEGVYVTGWYPPERDKRWQRMRDVVREYAFADERIDTGDPGEQTTWVAYTVFTAVARTLDPGDITADNVRQALDRSAKVSTGGLTPDLSWRFDDMLALSHHPRIVNTAVTYQVVRNGQLVEARRGFFDVRKVLEDYEASES